MNCAKRNEYLGLYDAYMLQSDADEAGPGGKKLDADFG